MCGCMPPDQLTMAKEIAEVVALSAAPLGMGVSLVATLFLARGARRGLSAAMVGCGVALIVFSLLEDRLDLGRSVESLFFAVFWASFIFLGVLSLVYFPERSRWINLSLVVGIGVTLAAAVTHQSLMLWSDWLRVAS